MAQPQEKINPYRIARNTSIDRTLINPNKIPRELWNYRQFVCWEYKDTGKPKLDKVPINPLTLGNAGSTYRNTWSDIRTAVATYKANEYLAGIGFVVTVGDPYVVIDLDGCLTDGRISQYAGVILDALNTYAEISPSGRGLRLITRCRTLPEVRKADDLGFEMYSTVRFATLTGNVYQSNPIASFDDLEWLVDRVAPRQKNDPTPPAATQERHILAVNPDDTALWDRMFRSKYGAKIRRLYDGDTSDHPSPSEADESLCARLKFFTGNDLERVDRMFRQSGLYRDKWNQPDRTYGTYGARTIARARSTQQYTGGKAR